MTNSNENLGLIDVKEPELLAESSEATEVSGLHFIFSKEGSVAIQHGEEGHFYSVPSKNVKECQNPTRNLIAFSKKGLENVRMKYGTVYVPGLLLDIVNCVPSEKDVKYLINEPDAMPYWDELFLIKPNIGHDAFREKVSNAKSQKMNPDGGLALCAWFVPKYLVEGTEESRKLFQALAADGMKKKLVENLVTSVQEKAKSDDYRQKQRTINDIKEQDGEYLATILDINERHLPLLENLQKKTMEHLEKRYGVNENDHIALYFHFPYAEKHASLHLHIRVNQGMHPTDFTNTFMLDDVLSCLRSGREVSELVLEKQKKNNSGFHWFDLGFFRTVEGVTVTENDRNPNVLEKDKSARNLYRAKDDFYVEPKGGVGRRGR